MLEEKINGLKKELIGYATLVENMISKSVRGLLNREKTPLLEVVNDLEPVSNDFEVSLDKLCMETIAKFGPRARDLRAVLMIYKMNSDLERMGDHAVNIAESGLFLVSKPPVKPLIDIPRMTDETVRNLSDSIKSFINEDAGLAQVVCERDYIIDALQNQIFRELVTFMTSDATTIERSVHLIRISNNLERIADLATNICEDVIFMVEGRVIKHHIEDQT